MKSDFWPLIDVLLGYNLDVRVKRKKKTLFIIFIITVVIVKQSAISVFWCCSVH